MKSLTLFIGAMGLLSCNSMAQNQQPDMEIPDGIKTEVATLGAGCFWCVEAVFQDLKGVYLVESGYSNGHVDNPTYREVCSGTTGHAEVARITFDPAVISFETLLKVFWTTHDPTTLNRQGNDVGTQYRSGIYYHSDAQRRIAEKSKAEFAPTLWSDPIVTEIVPAARFYKAEDYHQNYYNENPNAGYCRIIINPKVRKVREKFGHLLKEEVQ
ncbi:MAG: peptide-methionine (S)-S-oxide reductase MsrA [Saprospiraceae bacterium]|nr:peptide-methionine (S)-S-oxide reductase MsrA [Saprospiraceae bacterium]